MSKTELARMIDHTLLKPAATQDQIGELCAQARAHHFATVCVNPIWVATAAELLDGSDVAVCTVAGFPLGATTTAVKVYEAEQAIAAGAAEIDMVIHIGALKAGDDEAVQADIAALVQACHTQQASLKVIIEAALLSEDEKRRACKLALAAGADYVKTSTGFAAGGATVADVKLMRETVGPEMGVKAAGGIRSYADALAMIAAGATRLGASAGVQIVQEASQ